MNNQDGGRPSVNPDIQEKVDNARLVSKFVGVGNYTLNIGTEVDTEDALRSATEGVAYYRDGLGNLFLNTSIVDNQQYIELEPGAPLQTPFVSRTVDFGALIQAEEFDNGLEGIAYLRQRCDQHAGRKLTAATRASTRRP